MADTETRLDDVRACVFDAYGTLFDVTAAARQCRDALGDDVDHLAEVWRSKQLQYTWLRALMGRHGDFWQVTGDALDYAMASLRIDNSALRQKLMELYLSLDAYPEVAGVLKRLRKSGMKTAILSNGSPRMLEAAAANAGISASFDALLSVEEVGVYKPHPSVYQLACDRLSLPAARMSFQSSNAWDAAAAAAFGYQVVWVNRFAQPRENIPGEPAVEIRTLDPLPGIVGAG